MSQEELLLLGEMERFGVPQVDKDASIGNAITPALKAGIYSPSGKEYNLFLRIKSDSKSLVKLDLKGTARTIKIDNNMNKYKIYDAGSFYLKEGINELVISSAGGENVFIDSYLFVSKAIHPEKDYGSSQIFNYKKLSPTKYIIHSKSKTPFFLFFSERFDPKWQLKYRGKEFRHIMANGFANLYYIDEAGEGSLVLEYSDQNYFVLGQIITVVSWIMLLAVLIYFIRYSKIKLNDK
jgi:hypothetical protein